MATEKVIKPINIHSYSERREAGLLWYNGTFMRDPSVWTKTPKEKKAIKRAKRWNVPDFASSWSFKKHPIPCYGKLIIQFDKIADKATSHTTRTFQCGQSDLPEIIGNYSKDGWKVRWYKWNGKQYAADEFPEYYW